MSDVKPAPTSAAQSLRVPRVDRGTALGVLALIVAFTSLMVAFSRANATDIDDVRMAVDEVRLAVDDVANDAVNESDLGNIQGRLDAMETNVAEVAASIDELKTTTEGMAVASKVEAIVADLSSRIDSLKRTVSDLCDRVDSAGSGVDSSGIYVVRPPSIC
jgi:hypothetical protein